MPEPRTLEDGPRMPAAAGGEDAGTARKRNA